jgi:hypothetical protein
MMQADIKTHVAMNCGGRIMNNIPMRTLSAAARVLTPM